MATWGVIGTYTMDAASATSLTSALLIDGVFQQYALQIPSGATTWCATTTCNIRFLGAVTSASTYYQIGYQNGYRATATSGFQIIEVGFSACRDGGIVMIEGTYLGRNSKLQFSNTATAGTNFNLLGMNN